MLQNEKKSQIYAACLVSLTLLDIITQEMQF